MFCFLVLSNKLLPLAFILGGIRLGGHTGIAWDGCDFLEWNRRCGFDSWDVWWHRFDGLWVVIGLQFLWAAESRAIAHNSVILVGFGICCAEDWLFLVLWSGICCADSFWAGKGWGWWQCGMRIAPFGMGT